MPARKRRRPISARSRDNKVLSRLHAIKKIILLALLVFSMIVAVVVWNSLQTTYWKNDSKIIIAAARAEGDVTVYIIDPVNEDLVSVILPAYMEVEVANQLGVWKLGSVWELGKNEKLDGKLLAFTLVKHLKFPVYLWSDASADTYINANPATAIITSLKPQKTNIPIGDRMRIAMFSAKVGNRRSVIDLRDTKFIKSDTLTDGEKGFRLSGGLPKNVIAALSYPEFTNSVVNVRIEDATQKFNVAASVAGVINNMGGKVVSVLKLDESELDCEVWGNKMEAVEVVAKVFTCEVVNFESGFDINIRLGKRFVERY